MENPYAQSVPKNFRQLVRAGTWTTPTSGVCEGYAQANLLVIPKHLAYDFLLFTQRNPKPCPVLEVLDIGCPEPRFTALGADIRTDLPRYRVYRRGELTDEAGDLQAYWQEDAVAFLLGCSFSFEAALLNAGIPIRNIAEGKNVSMYVTNLACRPAGIFHGPLVVSMRPIPAALVVKAVQVTSRFPAVHGAPVHIGDPAEIGIQDISRPDFGDPVEVKAGEVPVFWACGVTPQAVVMTVKPESALTHAPGHMFVTDIPNEQLAAL
ncbi:putative hydro-lyase [candidate division KSB3 bacterium]|uniref:Hydro-lyase n=1 Tax=candidate division KSB3 bacterium TaxID=2044937 RepID=A0A9D5JWZ1_9BACT|nr:putative hydro-lyase [candidate division KSB3 bacterium]MBD3325832.1 putative hydro-lyase [candidate division KSB3 bacterium]